jgi:trans-2,3-dihydro-3-hydroxyanthranilate isomerase
VRTLPYLHYDVFTDVPLLGNQLAVFTAPGGIDSALMQAVTREMAYSESTFVLAAERPDTDVRMRIFTPAAEMPMAGHPTVGTTFALAHTGVIAPGTPRFVFGLNVGPTPVDLEWDGARLRFAWMTQAPPSFGAPVEARAAVAQAIGLHEDDLVPGLPVQPVSCGVPFLFVPLRERATVDRATSDAAAFARLAADTDVNLPIFLFAMLPPGEAATVHSRMFAPELGIVEDPATGGASGPLGCYLVEHGLVRGAAARLIVSQQGVAMGRASRIHIEITGDPGSISQVRIGGHAVRVGQGALEL